MSLMGRKLPVEGLLSVAYDLVMQLPLKPSKPKQTLNDLLNSNQLVKGKVVLDKKLAEQKLMAEAIEFEMRNRRATTSK